VPNDTTNEFLARHSGANPTPKELDAETIRRFLDNVVEVAKAEAQAAQDSAGRCFVG